MSTSSPQLPTALQPLLFNNLGSRQVVTDFSAGHLSSDGGMLLLRQIDEGLGISRSLAGCFRDLRNPLLIEHSVRELVAQRLLGLAAGYEDLNDHNLLRLDPLFAVVVGKEDPLGNWACSRRIKARRWPALRPSTGSNLVTIKIPVVTKSAPTMRRSRTPFCRWGCAVCPSIAKRSSSIWMPVTIRCTASRKDVSFTASMAATAICRSLPLSAQSRSGPSFAPATGTPPEGPSRHSRKSFRRCVNVAPKRGSLSGPIAAFVARRSWLGVKLKSQRSIIVWAWLATAGYGNCWRINLLEFASWPFCAAGWRAALQSSNIKPKKVGLSVAGSLAKRRS